jgi:hypothetical protein
MGGADHSGQAALGVSVRGRPRANADAHGGLPLPDRWSAPAGPLALNRRDYPASPLLVTE